MSSPCVGLTFYARLDDGIHRVAPRARLVKLDVPPVCGAALLGLDRLSPTGTADERQADELRAAFAAADWSDR